MLVYSIKMHNTLSSLRDKLISTGLVCFGNVMAIPQIVVSALDLYEHVVVLS
jgi:hypothetical protein